MRNLVKISFLAGLAVAVALAAQTTTYEVKSGTVVAVFDDQLVVKMPNGDTREITVPADFKFDVDGKQVGLADLKPGARLDALITTTKTPQKVKTVQIKKGEVIKVAGNTVWFRHDGKYKAYAVPPGFKVTVEGETIKVTDLLPGTQLTAEIVYTTEKNLTEREVQVSGRSPAPPS